MASLSLHQRHSIAFRAATVYQRVAAFTQRGSASASAAPIDPHAGAALRAWSQAFSPGDRDAFLRRLRWDDLEWDTVGRALSDTPDLEASAPEQVALLEPDWTVWLDLIFERAPEVARELEAGPLVEAGYFEGIDEPPFIELAVPALRAALGFLAEAHPGALAPFAEAARCALERQLLKELSAFAERTTHELFQQVKNTGSGAAEPLDDDRPPSTERYRAFVLSMLDGGLPAFFAAYPVLARLTAVLIEKWVESVGELSRRLEADRREIAERFCDGADPGPVASIKPGLSDPHNGRRRVLALTFESGLRLVYKPRDVGLEEALSGFLAWSNERGLDPRQHTLRVIARPGYGWIEFAAQEAFADVDEVRRYYRQAGGLILLAHLLRATDLHMENLVATRRGPVLVDTESLLQPGRAIARESRPSLAASEADDPCVATGLLTFGEIGVDGQRYEIGGLRGEGWRGSSRPRRMWHSIGSDALHFSEGHEFFAPSTNRVLLMNVVQKPEDFRDEILAGFAATYRFFASLRDDVLRLNGPLAAFAGRRARVMFRPTNQYAIVQDVLAVPKYQMSGIARSGALDILARPFALDRTRPVAWPLAVEERRGLENLDIPHFTVGTDETAVCAAERRVSDRFFTRSGLDAVRERVRRLSEDDLQTQLQWLVRSLSESAGSHFHVDLTLPPTEASPDRVSVAQQQVALATWIGREFVERAVRHRDTLKWSSQPPGEAVTEAAEHYLYGGTLGPALFLAALAHVTGDRAWTDAARMACAGARMFADRSDLREALAGEPIGVGNGMGSLVYGLRWVGKLLGDESYVEAAARVAQSIDVARIEADRDLDVLAGSAGAILALLALPSHIGADRVADLAIACGDHLVATQLHTHWGSNWPSRDGRLLAGFAHGAAGIAYALVRLYRTTGRRAYLEAALRAHRYERAVFSPVHRNWPLVRSAGHLPGNVAVLMTAWCHGAPGIALARACVRDVVIEEDPEVSSEIDVALDTTARLTGNAGDHLCCGNIGRCDVLLTAGRLLDRPAAIDAAATIAASVRRQAVRRRRFQLVSSGFEHVVFDAGFFQGLAGVGYELLRLAAPSRLPSILAFEGHVASDSHANVEEHVYS